MACGTRTTLKTLDLWGCGTFWKLGQALGYDGTNQFAKVNLHSNEYNGYAVIFRLL